MNPKWSAFLAGGGSVLLFLFVATTISRIRHDEQARQEIWRWVEACIIGWKKWWKNVFYAGVGISLIGLLLWGVPKVFVATPPVDQTEVLRMMRTLRGHMISLKFGHIPEEPSSFSDLDAEMHAKVLAEKLQSLGFAPPGGYTVSFDAQGIRRERYPIDDWLVYLTFMLPYVEEFGVEQALEEAHVLREDMARTAEQME